MFVVIEHGHAVFIAIVKLVLKYRGAVGSPCVNRLYRTRNLLVIAGAKKGESSSISVGAAVAIATTQAATRPSVSLIKATAILWPCETGKFIFPI